MSKINKVVYFIGVIIYLLLSTVAIWAFSRWGLIWIAIFTIIILAYYLIFIRTIKEQEKRNKLATVSILMVFIVIWSVVLIFGIYALIKNRQEDREYKAYQKEQREIALEEEKKEKFYEDLLDRLYLPKWSIIELNKKATHKPFITFTAWTGEHKYNSYSDAYYREINHYVTAYIKASSWVLEDVELLSIDPEWFEQSKCDKMKEQGATLEDFQYVDARCVNDKVLKEYNIDTSLYTEAWFRKKLDISLDYDLDVGSSHYPYYYIGTVLKTDGDRMLNWKYMLVYVSWDNAQLISDRYWNLKCYDIRRLNVPEHAYYKCDE